MKTLEELFGDFYSPLHALSYGRPWIFSTGSRSIGKSTGWTIWLLYQYLKYGRRFIYLRRTDDEVRMTAPTCFDSAVIIMKEGGYDVYSVTAEKGKFWLRRNPESPREEIGCYLALSQSLKRKSSNYGDNDYWYIIYDEFISLDSTKYLGNSKNITFEYVLCDALYRTVDRKVGCPKLGRTKFIFLANLSSYFNPIFIGLGIDAYIRTDSKILAPEGKNWIVEQTKSVKATEDVICDGSSLSAYNDNNIAFDAKMNFVEKIKEPMKAMYNLKWGNETYGAYYVPGRDCMYISKNKTCLQTISLTCDGQDKMAFTLAIRPSDNLVILRLRQVYYLGKVICENRRIRYLLANYFMLTP